MALKLYAHPAPALFYADWVHPIGEAYANVREPSAIRDLPRRAVPSCRTRATGLRRKRRAPHHRLHARSAAMSALRRPARARCRAAGTGVDLSDVSRRCRDLADPPEVRAPAVRERALANRATPGPLLVARMPGLHAALHRSGQLGHGANPRLRAVLLGVARLRCARLAGDADGANGGDRASTGLATGGIRGAPGRPRRA